jgi:hypothetical protein
MQPTYQAAGKAREVALLEFGDAVLEVLLPHFNYGWCKL